LLHIDWARALLIGLVHAYFLRSPLIIKPNPHTNCRWIVA
jgi:hypothetical protein